MQIAIPLYDRFTALDAIGPYEVLSRLPDSRRHVRRHRGRARTRPTTACSRSSPRPRSTTFRNPEILCVPGGWGTRDAMSDERLVDWIRDAHETSEWTTSVCTGSLLLGAAGVLDGLDATTPLARAGDAGRAGRHARPAGAWSSRARSSPPPASRRASTWRSSCWRRSPATSSRKTIQLLIEYDPQPPFDAGSPEKAPPEIVAAAAGARGARQPAYLEEGLALAAVGRDLVHDPVAGHEVERVEALAQLAGLRVAEVDAVADAQVARGRARAPASAPRPRPRSGRGCRPGGQVGGGDPAGLARARMRDSRRRARSRSRVRACARPASRTSPRAAGGTSCRRRTAWGRRSPSRRPAR